MLSRSIPRGRQNSKSVLRPLCSTPRTHITPGSPDRWSPRYCSEGMLQMEWRCPISWLPGTEVLFGWAWPNQATPLNRDSWRDPGSGRRSQEEGESPSLTLDWGRGRRGDTRGGEKHRQPLNEEHSGADSQQGNGSLAVLPSGDPSWSHPPGLLTHRNHELMKGGLSSAATVVAARGWGGAGTSRWSSEDLWGGENTVCDAVKIDTCHYTSVPSL